MFEFTNEMQRSNDYSFCYDCNHNYGDDCCLNCDYFHDDVVEYVANLVNRRFDCFVVYNVDNNTVTVHNLSLDTLRTFVDEYNLQDLVHDMDYLADYDYNDDDVVYDTTAVVLYLNEVM